MRRQSLTPAGRTDDSMTSVVRKCAEVELDIIVLWKVFYRCFKSVKHFLIIWQNSLLYTLTEHYIREHYTDAG